MKIKELSKITNLSISTIRYYEKIGLIAPMKNGYYKEYTNEIKDELFIIKKLHFAGLKLSEILYLFSLNNEDIENLNLLERNKIKGILNSSIKSITLKQEQLSQSKEMLDKMLKKVIHYENGK